MRPIEQKILDNFREHEGYAIGECFGAGIEGWVYELPDTGKVVKITTSLAEARFCMWVIGYKPSIPCIPEIESVREMNIPESGWHRVWAIVREDVPNHGIENTVGDDFYNLRVEALEVLKKFGWEFNDTHGENWGKRKGQDFLVLRDLGYNERLPFTGSSIDKILEANLVGSTIQEGVE